jgi:single-stranded DNA-binding protein
MSVAVLISGSIFKEPQERTSSSGRKYVTTTLKAAAADNASSDFWSVLAFGTTAGAELMRLAVGERVTIQGGLKLELYTANDGATKISRTIFADHAMALRQPPKERRAKAAKPATSQEQTTTIADATPAKETAAGGPAFFSDDIPFEAVR